MLLPLPLRDGRGTNNDMHWDYSRMASGSQWFLPT